MARKQVGLDAALVDQIDKVAEKRGMSRTALVEHAVRVMFEGKGKSPPRVVTGAHRPVGRPAISAAKRNARPAYPKANKR